MRKLIIPFLIVTATCWISAQSPDLEHWSMSAPEEHLQVLTDTLTERSLILDALLSEVDRSLRYAPHADSYYRNYFFACPDADITVLCALDAEDYVFAAARELVGHRRVIFSGVPGSPDALSEAVLSAPGMPTGTPTVELVSGNETLWIIGSGRKLTPGWFAESIVRNAGDCFSVSAVHALRLGFGSRDAGLTRLLDAGTAAVQLQLSPEYDLNLDLALRQVENTLPLVREPDVNYAIVPVLSKTGTPSIIPEGILVAGVFVVFALMLLYAHIRPRRSLQYAHAIIRRLPTIVLFFTVMTTGLVVANLMLQVIIGERSSLPDLLPFVVMKGTFSIIMMGLFFRLFRVHLSRSTTVYAAGAIVLLLFAVMISGIVSLPVSVYVMAMFVAAFFFSLSPGAWMKAAMLILCLVPPVYLLGGFLVQDDPALALAVLIPSLWHEALVAVFVLPVFLMLLRLEHLTPRLSLIRIVSVTSLVLLAASTILVFIGISETPTDLSIVEIHKNGNAAVLISPPPPAESFLSGPGDLRKPVSCDGDPCLVEIPDDEPSVLLTLDERQELNRRVYTITAQFDRPAEYIRFFLESDTEMLLYRTDLTSFPAVGTRSRVFEFQPGAAPPMEISHSIALVSEPLSPRLTLWAVAVFPDSSYTVISDSSTPISVTSRRVIEELSLGAPPNG